MPRSQNTLLGVVFQVLAADRTLAFDTTSIDDQFYNIDTAVNLTLPQATGGTGTLAYTLMPRDSIPFGLLFNSDSAERTLTGTPTATVTTAVILTYTVTDSATPTPATIALDFMMTVTKRLQTDFSFASTKVTKTIDDSSFTETATGGFDFSMVTYESSDTEVATVDTDSGEVTILTIGSTTITATLAANDDYNEATAIYILTVTPAAPTFDDSANIPDQVYTVGQDVSLELPVATGGITPLKYTLELRDSIPSGLDL